MGLDQYAYVSENGEHNDDSRDICYWRKHNRLQGWMENKYIDDGGTKEFNCVAVELTLEDIEQLDIVINNRMLPETGGFFFGDDSYSYEDEDSNESGGYYHKEADVSFIKDARQAFANGKKVYYNSWW